MYTKRYCTLCRAAVHMTECMQHLQGIINRGGIEARKADTLLRIAGWHGQTAFPERYHRSFKDARRQMGR